MTDEAPIVVVLGGPSAEHDVSIVSGTAAPLGWKFPFTCSRPSVKLKTLLLVKALVT